MRLKAIQGGGSPFRSVPPVHRYTIAHKDGADLRRFSCIATSIPEAFSIAKAALGASTITVGFKGSPRKGGSL